MLIVFRLVVEMAFGPLGHTSDRALTSPAARRYRTILFNARPCRIVATIGAVAATLALSMLPTEHVHTSHAGRAVAHRHVIDDRPEHAGSLAHGDHGGVTTREPSFVSELQHAVNRPLITVEMVPAVPARRSAGRVALIDPLMTHGPPIRVSSLRGPPA